MIQFRVLVAALFVGIIGYTIMVVSNYGWNLIPAYISAIAEVSWQGQFTVDFSFYLLLSAVWITWRHRYSPLGFTLGGLALIGGMMFFAPYLLVASIRARGEITPFLLGSEQSDHHQRANVVGA